MGQDRIFWIESKMELEQSRYFRDEIFALAAEQNASIGECGKLRKENIQSV